MDFWQKKIGLGDWKISLEIVDFLRKDFRQSGDFRADPQKKEATLMMTWDPYRNEEETVVHELVHILLWDMDSFSEKIILRSCEYGEGEHDEYLGRLEDVVGKLTHAFIGK